MRAAGPRRGERDGGAIAGAAGFDPLDHPILFATPKRLTKASGWREHIPLGMLLVDLARPATLVELGTQGGDSYCAFCQAVLELGLETSCYAIDTWEGDEHTGRYGPEVLAELRAHHDPAYGSFSRLVRGTFEEALPHFEDGQVDFLHIDGHHAYESVKRDFESWLPKMSPRGLVLLHDINVTEGDFGVDRLWGELRPAYPHYEVRHGHGLGVLAVGERADALDPLLELEDGRARAFRRLLFALGRRFSQSEPGRGETEEELRIEGLAMELGAAREELRRERELEARREQEHAAQLAERTARAEALAAEMWSWCVRSELQREEVQRLQATRTWRYTRPLRSITRLLGRRGGVPRIEFPPIDSPRTSLLIPIHSQPELTAACLHSIAANTEPVYEVVLADDHADRATKRLLRSVRGARRVVNERNMGFTRTVNRAAADCDSEFIVICNNDIEVRPGWLSALMECAESAPDIAIVVPKYLRPDGTIAEAGAIVWADGSARHVGSGRDVNHPRFNYRREVDYGSAAAMLVRTEFWRQVGGFDERFSPGYYEDTDLCFAARARGLRVMYEPRAEVVHVQGGSAGVDEESGFKAHQRLNAPKFAEKWRAALERQPPPSDSDAAIRAAADRAAGPRVLLIDHRVPSPDLDSGSVRMTQMIRALISLGCSVRFLPDNSFKWEPYCGGLQRMGVEVMHGITDIRGELAQIGPELSLVLMSRPAPAARFLHLVRELAPEAIAAYDTVDLHFVREGRRAKVEGAGETPLVEALRAVELAMVRATDVTICVSEAEAETLSREVPEARTVVISNAHEVATEVPPPRSRDGLLFVGDFIHTPNTDAARYLVDEVMPLVWGEVPDAVLRIIGNGAEEKVGVPADERIVVEGWVEDLEGYMDRARVNVAPLRYGAGVKGKITHSLSRGLPVVTTAVGAEGLHATPGRDLLVADEAEELARETVRLMTEDELWAAVSENGLALAARRFSPDRVADAIGALLEPAREWVAP